MATKRKSRSSGRSLHVHKARGQLGPRVQKVGPERFGLMLVDPAKRRSMYTIADYYGRKIVPPTTISHDRDGFAEMMKTVVQARKELDDLVVVIEQCGRYHEPIERVARSAGLEVRLLPALVTKQMRMTADPGNKTDQTDLDAMHRAAVAGLGLLKPDPDPHMQRLQLVERHRRDLVWKNSQLSCQIHEHLEPMMPGFTGLFRLWDTPIALRIAHKLGSAELVRTQGVDGLHQLAADDHIRVKQKTLERIVAWAGKAAEADPQAPTHRQVIRSLLDDRQRKVQEISKLERQMARFLAKTPFVLLLSCPGINVVSAAELAGEAGPISQYLNAKAIAGRAGLYPSRYQSDRTDHPNGPLVRCSNRRLRAAILIIAENLIEWNPHHRVLAERWKREGADARDIRVRVGSRFTRMAFCMVAGGKVFDHPSCRGGDPILAKLLRFHLEHRTPRTDIIRDIQAVMEQLHATAIPKELAELEMVVQSKRRAVGDGERSIGHAINQLITSLRAGGVQSGQSGG